MSRKINSIERSTLVPPFSYSSHPFIGCLTLSPICLLSLVPSNVPLTLSSLHLIHGITYSQSKLAHRPYHILFWWILASIQISASSPHPTGVRLPRLKRLTVVVAHHAISAMRTSLVWMHPPLYMDQ
ncbi:hypothetical protein SORBI_3002G025600 [Sorghum bicolor]|uniref:Uncharacterized protein n=1 Tax=Sorghum bicolor TaxID=4558 RepID=A0A1B6Q8U5_SORBI|nr:hypothetical protein SORBI_3002G025600 [Sorghum bicolor]